MSSPLQSSVLVFSLHEAPPLGLKSRAGGQKSRILTVYRIPDRIGINYK